MAILVTKPDRLDGAECLVVDRYAAYANDGLTEVAALLRTAKDATATNRCRMDAAELLWQRVAEAVRCIPAKHPARRAKAIVHVPISPSNRFALNAVACAASEALKIDVFSCCLGKCDSAPRMKGAPPQVKAMIAHKYWARDLPEGRLLVIDDLVESGASLAESGRALRAAGAIETSYLAAVALG